MILFYYKHTCMLAKCLNSIQCYMQKISFFLLAYEKCIFCLPPHKSNGGTTYSCEGAMKHLVPSLRFHTLSRTGNSLA